MSSYLIHWHSVSDHSGYENSLPLLQIPVCAPLLYQNTRAPLSIAFQLEAPTIARGERWGAQLFRAQFLQLLNSLDPQHLLYGKLRLARGVLEFYWREMGH